MSEDQVEFSRDRPKSWPAGFFITSEDIQRYIEEFQTEADLAIEKTKYKVGLIDDEEEDWRKDTIWEKRLVETDDS
ncbi:uncharacterized protein METZ01_LOCUS291639 [marine metagenome]|uniref:Uncharacterized protein n=1 Tax=marine metagenome TaxID=408172 RepID=A0A382LSQ2_9ZZZZ|tara:strand:- start:665 stop:892 length:228 start_codon:yes stop_codon:yes gene_type:complete